MKSNIIIVLPPTPHKRPKAQALLGPFSFNAMSQALLE